MKKRVPEQIKPETSLQAKMTTLKLSCFGHIMRRQGSLEKTTMLGRIESSRKRGRPNMRWIESKKEATGMSLQKLSRVVEDRTLWATLIQSSSGVRANSMACNTLFFQIPAHHYFPGEDLPRSSLIVFVQNDIQPLFI